MNFFKHKFSMYMIGEPPKIPKTPWKDFKRDYHTYNNNLTTVQADSTYNKQVKASNLKLLRIESVINGYPSGHSSRLDPVIRVSECQNQNVTDRVYKSLRATYSDFPFHVEKCDFPKYSKILLNLDKA